MVVRDTTHCTKRRCPQWRVDKYTSYVAVVSNCEEVGREEGVGAGTWARSRLVWFLSVATCCVCSVCDIARCPILLAPSDVSRTAAASRGRTHSPVTQPFSSHSVHYRARMPRTCEPARRPPRLRMNE